MLKLRRDDLVYVITGKDRGKKGKILKLFPKGNKAIVEGINFAKKHRRKTREDQQGGIVQIETPIDISNLIFLCKHCNQPTRIAATILKDGSKVRICKKCKEVI
jgi:large subunit ribosomal protein L24